ncbi:MAG: FKBP-type peptidyl-prolyl cis-trans isomerase [Bacteroidales bacterium]|nr:FKBP-type peptidyl-prolyl cis-trans isomerase [Bacteroidales bacterium]
MEKWLYFAIMIVFLSCQEKRSENRPEIDPTKYNKALEKANQYYSRSDEMQIEDYCARHNINPIKTSSGLRYLILEKGKGSPIEEKDEVTFHYHIRLINDVLIESSRDKGPKKIIVGYSSEISGLTQGLQLLCEGDRALFIIPSHLAYGWVTESENIPPKSILIYEVKVVQVKKPS